MEPGTIGIIGMVSLIVLLGIRVPVGIALSLVSLLGLWMIRGFNGAMGALKGIPYDFTAHWTLSAIPMFLLMGTIVANSGMTTSLYAAMRVWLGWLPGGLAVATNFAGAGFAAASGSSMATTATLGRIAVPEMLKSGYNPGLATGVASAVGTLGAVIPPSIIVVLFAIFAQAPVGQVLIAGIIPGLLTAFAYATLIVLRVKLNPALAPRQSIERVGFAGHMRLLAPIWPLPVLVLGVIGGIYSGFMTATESGAAGVVLAIIVAMIQRTFSLSMLWSSLKEAATTTASLILIAVGAALFTRFLAFSGIPNILSDLIAAGGASQLSIILSIAVVYILLGCFLDPLGVLLLTLPVLLPVFASADMNIVWMGIILVKFIEIGMLTPPVGLNVFVMKGVVGDDVRLVQIFKGVTWFLLAEVVVMAILIAFPQVTLFLPNLMR
ncbi:tripartite ATP-independent transporter DctM subunit [Maritimibacter alkaliphilus HTCC2654]|uniref:TRAP transporter large permease protein n=1 Tax=Maritimibacter alkaliphilus HTCC2654 TaxID=314271 RepID=A3VLN8_9RHOB|nr:TRAP transporter large permease [Maritimibacter alkaliphilus]EAQ10815.1 TRAP-T family transporter, DctM (12 TMs) subunit [Rhodobacterales bacterium HTCC2654] [Maritimibacter alkaliphilus HTCC2654]TYP80532.1 tripartite ATP-independent transporter DctM subunit [Maritimibacter alkaliphilus HTCC2654]